MKHELTVQLICDPRDHQKFATHLLRCGVTKVSRLSPEAFNPTAPAVADVVVFCCGSSLSFRQADTMARAWSVNRHGVILNDAMFLLYGYEEQVGTLPAHPALTLEMTPTDADLPPLAANDPSTLEAMQASRTTLLSDSQPLANLTPSSGSIQSEAEALETIRVLTNHFQQQSATANRSDEGDLDPQQGIDFYVHRLLQYCRVTATIDYYVRELERRNACLGPWSGAATYTIPSPSDDASPTLLLTGASPYALNICHYVGTRADILGTPTLTVPWDSLGREDVDTTVLFTDVHPNVSTRVAKQLGRSGDHELAPMFLVGDDTEALITHMRRERAPTISLLSTEFAAQSSEICALILSVARKHRYLLQLSRILGSSLAEPVQQTDTGLFDPHFAEHYAHRLTEIGVPVLAVSIRIQPDQVPLASRETTLEVVHRVIADLFCEVLPVTCVYTRLGTWSYLVVLPEFSYSQAQRLVTRLDRLLRDVDYSEPLVEGTRRLYPFFDIEPIGDTVSARALFALNQWDDLSVAQ